LKTRAHRLPDDLPFLATDAKITLATIAAAALAKCVARYDEERCTSFLTTDEHHIVARSAALAKPARDILQEQYHGAFGGVGFPGGVPAALCLFSVQAKKLLPKLLPAAANLS
jgi:hypothetical protein